MLKLTINISSSENVIHPLVPIREEDHFGPLVCFSTQTFTLKCQFLEQCFYSEVLFPSNV